MAESGNDMITGLRFSVDRFLEMSTLSVSLWKRREILERTEQSTASSQALDVIPKDYRESERQNAQYGIGLIKHSSCSSTNYQRQ